mmetsp:Transcript_3378/g.12654  ORF Transcript_3378/g.12654 Transcript_3378/m.12654 type:complete len:153 (+) Transcript_3378:350-808(+)
MGSCPVCLPVAAPPGSHWTACENQLRLKFLRVRKTSTMRSPATCGGLWKVCARHFPTLTFLSAPRKIRWSASRLLEMVDRRVEEFGTWLRQWVRQQRKLNGSVQLDVIVVSHYVFLHRLLSAVERRGGSSGGPLGFENCEVRKFPLDSFLGQ